jgi:predicted AAA+ superfamily ATPase
MMAGAMSGALLENFAVTEILKTYQNAGREPHMYFYRDREAREIDLLLEGDGSLFPLEIKKAASPDPRLANVFRVIDKTPYKRGVGGILCLAETLTALNKDCLVIPIGMI